MDLTQAIKERRSIRLFKDTLVSKTDLLAIVEEARFAPSWRNTQSARYTFVQSPEVIAKLSEEGVYGFAYNANNLKRAKNVMVLSVVQGQSGRANDNSFATSKGDAWEVFDAGIACQTFLLSAYAHGIATCVMGIIDDAKIAEIVGLPENEKVAALVAFGYADDGGNPVSRLEPAEISRFIR